MVPAIVVLLNILARRSRLPPVRRCVTTAGCEQDRNPGITPGFLRDCDQLDRKEKARWNMTLSFINDTGTRGEHAVD
jgi:hypothetical protein